MGLELIFISASWAFRETLTEPMRTIRALALMNVYSLPIFSLSFVFIYLHARYTAIIIKATISGINTGVNFSFGASS